MTDLPLVALTPDMEAQVIDAARRDRRAFAPLYRAYVRPIYRYLYSRLNNAADAEDLTSQVFLEAIEGLPRYRHRGHFPAWLFTIARRRLINFHRRRRSETALDLDETQIEAGDVPLFDRVERNEEIRRLLQRFSALEPKDQELLRLRFVAELGYAEIAAVVGRREDTVKKRIYRLLARLQSRLEVDDE